jgi:hypothetical protein
MEESMRRFRTLLLAGLMVIGLLVGPGAGLATARPSTDGVTGAIGWLCTPHGSASIANGANGGPTTTLSAARIVNDDHSQDAISCYFPNINQVSSALLQLGGIEFGGKCYYNAGLNIGIEFRHRIYVVRGNTAALVCWDGFFECADSVTTTLLCSTITKATLRRTRA